MKEIQFSIDIHASKEKVWNTLWQDETLRKWANIIDPGTYMTGDLKEGHKIQFISSENGYGVTSLVEKIVEGEFLQLMHEADTQDNGKEEREKQWTGGKETYSLIQKDGTTSLIFTCDVPLELEEYFKVNYPKAFEKVKEMAEE